MGKLHSLTAHFEQAIANLRAVLPDMSKKALKEAGFSFKSVPELEVDLWNASRDKSNCYDFVLNRPGKFRNPGELSYNQPKKLAAAIDAMAWGEKVDFFEFANGVRKGLLRDGLIELGDKPELSERGTLVALFMGNTDDLEEVGRPGSNPDLHFYALRRDGKQLVWAHKPGKKEVENLGSDPAAPFTDAPKRGDRFFGGFWLVPNRA